MTVLEASNRIGGRVHDDHSLGPCSSRGAMFITGIANNPITLLCKQLGEKVWEINEERCELLTEYGGIADKDVDTKVEQQFNTALDRLAQWRNTKPPDCSLGGEGSSIARLLCSVYFSTRQTAASSCGHYQ